MKIKILIPILALGICYLVTTPPKKSATSNSTDAMERIANNPAPTLAVTSQKIVLDSAPAKMPLPTQSASSTDSVMPSEARAAVTMALTAYSAHPSDPRYLMHLGKTLAKLNTLTRQTPQLREETVAIYKSCFSDHNLGNDIRALCLSHSKQFVSKKDQHSMTQNLEPKLVRLATKLDL